MAVHFREIPGFSEHYIRNTYLSLLPTELRELIIHYYLFPIAIRVIAYIFNESGSKIVALAIEIIRQRGYEVIDDVTTDINIEDFFATTNKRNSYTRKSNISFNKLKNGLQITSSTNPLRMTNYYSRYETQQLENKLKFIQNVVDLYNDDHIDKMDTIFSLYI